jgi:tRNA-specific 2-thiouridylase
VAACLLVERGYAVQGLFMSNWEEDELGYCTAAEDYQDARRVADQLGIALHRVSFAREYRERVFSHFLDECRRGRTPNPDVLCNREIKFGVCREHARRLGARLFATGHYARIERDGDDYALLRAVDEAKDQSYFLHGIERAALANVLFPVGGMLKGEVRAYARAHGLAVHDKKDSTGICFIGERPFAKFLGQYLPARPGPIESTERERLGTHRGLMYYTLGQRQGLGVGGRRGASDQAWYVADKNLGRNALIVVQGRDHPRLLCQALHTEAIHWLVDRSVVPRQIQVQIRYRQRPVAAQLEVRDDGTAQVSFERPQRAVTPGQYAAFYAEDRCLGGAVIQGALPVLETTGLLRANG